MKALQKYLATFMMVLLMACSLLHTAAFAAEASRGDEEAEVSADMSTQDISDNELEMDEFNTESDSDDDSTTGAVIALTDVPAYNEKRPIQGQVFRTDGGDFKPSDYRISLFIQLEEGQTYWVKPTYDKPYVDLSSDGSFVGNFITGGNDELAKVIHVMLVPSDYVPAKFVDTKAVALDYVKITRTEEGGVTIDPAREAPVSDTAQPAINALDSVTADKLAVDVGFYTDGSQPGSALSESLIRAQLEAVSRFSDTVRFYGSAGELYKAYKIAHDMGFSIVGTAWLSGDETADKAEMDALIEHCKNGYVTVACVGNETLLAGTLTEDALIADINYVRDGLSDANIPVTTSDSVDVLIGSAAVRNACNLLMPNCYPFWGGADIDGAADAFIASINNLKAVGGDKQVLVSETGWPTGGSTLGAAVPNEANAARYFDEVRKWSLSSGIQVFYFAAADEPWKTGERDVGPHWGLMTSEFALKEGYAGSAFFTDNPLTEDISGAVMSGLKNKTYTGKAIEQTPVVKLGDETLTAGTDFTVSFANNKNAGTATVTVTGIGNYSGSLTGTFKINKAAQKITAKASAGKVAVGKTVTISVSDAKGKISYKSKSTSVATVSAAGKVTGKKVGSTVITVTSAATGNYKAASADVTVKVLPAATSSLKAANQSTGIKLTWKKVAGANGYVIYRDGSKIATVEDGSTVQYTDKKANTNGKKYQYKVAAKASTGTSTLSKSVTVYRISRPSLSSVTNSASKKMTVKWKKNSKVTGYQIQYSTSKTFASGVKKVSVKKASSVSRVIGSLKKGKTYYVRIRAYKKVGGTNYWSAWSTVKKIKIKK